MEKLIDRIKRHEGFVNRPYIDILAKNRIPENEYEIIKRLLPLIELRHNLFIPTMKIQRREHRENYTELR